ncbi:MULTISPECIES: YhdP family protein [unclassified Shewanella]|uniref:YhdP family protein n=1 Tax=unclassified Shewanella TaxID=196818 RepID=UPI001E59F20F|nr:MULTISPECIES: YhdP family protein [unclassified Shewanella]
MSSKTRKFNFLRVCLQSLAIVMVLFALFVSLFRGLLPQLDQVRLELVDYIHNKYQVEVQVGQLQAEWQAFGPALTVKNFVLPSQEKLPVTLLFEQVHVKFDFWQTLLTATPQIEDVIFDGVNVALDLDRLASTSTSSSSSTKMNTDWLYQLMLEQLERFSITNARIQLLSQKHQYRPIFIKDMHWRNTEKRHRGQGKLFLDEEASDIELLALSVDIKGDGHKPESLIGQFYLAAASLDIGEWASRQPNPFDANKKLQLEGVVNLEAWISFANREINDATVAFKPSWLEWFLNGEAQKFSIQAGAMRWHPDTNGWSLSSHDLSFATNGEQWPSPVLSAKQHGASIDAYLNTLDLATVLPLLPLLPGIELDTLQTWQALSPQGEITNTQLQWDTDKNQPQLSANAQQISWQTHGAIPGLSAIDAKVIVTDKELQFTLPAQQYVVDFDGGFEAPLDLKGDALTGQFDFATSALSLPKLHFSNADISVDAATRLEFSGATHMALLANLNINNVANAHRYFPLKGMSAGLVDYLTGALKAGKTDDAVIVWQGAFEDYPYSQSAGVFQAGFTLADANFKFQDTWPAVSNLNLSALFENAAMDLWVNKGQLMDVSADGAYIGIPLMNHESMLIIKADLATKAEAANAVIQASPLADSVGSTLDVVQISGDITGQIDLSIPLFDGVDEIIQGTVNFDNTPVYISEPGIQLDNVSGQIQFINDVVTGSDINALMYSQPLTFSFDTGRINKNYAVNVDLTGHWLLDNLPNELNNPLSDYYSGELDWTGGLMLIFDPSGYRIQARVDSDLLGTELALPAPFTKASTKTAEFTAELIGDNKESSLGIKLDKQLEFWGGFDLESGNGLAHFDLLLGRLFKPGDQLRKTKGHLQIDLDKTEFSPWLPIIQSFTAKSEKTLELDVDTGVESGSLTATDSFFPPLVSIEANFNDLDLMGQPLNDLHFNAGPTEYSWRFDATSEQFDGRIDFYPDWVKQGLKVVASKLYMSPKAKTDETAHFKSDTVLANLPPLAVDVDDFRLFDKSMGHLVLQASPKDDTYQIQTLSLSSPEVQLKGKGTWSIEDGQSLTSFNLTLDSTKFDFLSAKLGIDPGLKDAPTSVVGEISWIGAPYAFSLDTLDGEVRFDLGKGHLSEVSDKGARIFSLFSLDSLLRKLSLDFSDVFGKGLYFDSFGGTLMLDNGVVKTTDTEMKAVAGNMRVRGYTDLTTESLNYDIRFVPQLASSVPTVILLSTGGWTLGLGAFALTKVLEPVIEVISEIRFRLTGTMSEPKLEELERKSKEIEIPESVLPKKAVEPAEGSGQDSASEKQPEDAVSIPSSNSTSKIVPAQGQVLEPISDIASAKVGLKMEANGASETSQSDKTIEQSNLKESGQTMPALKLIPGESDASKPTAMSEQPQRNRESRIYRVAA